MKLSQRGLATIKSADLKKLLSALHKGDLPVPLNIEGLTRFGLQHCATDLTGHLRGLDGRAIMAVVVAVLAERAAVDDRPQSAVDGPAAG